MEKDKSDLKLLKDAIPEFHCFKCNGRFFLFHINSSLIINIDENKYNDFQIAKGCHRQIFNLDNDFRELLVTISNHTSKSIVTDDNTEEIIDSLLSHSPRNLMLFITNECNLSCSYCYENNYNKNINRISMSFSFGKEVIDYYFAKGRSRSALTITFFGGEPLLNFSVLRDITEYSKRKASAENKEVDFCITTNGTIMNDDIIQYLVENEFGVMLSFDGPRRIHDMNRVFKNGDGSHKVVLRNAKRLLRKQIDSKVLPLKVRSTLTRETYKEYDKVLEYFIEELPGARIMIPSYSR